MTLRIGRQELGLGSERLISVDDGSNNRRTFEGVRATLALDAWRLDGLALRPTARDRPDALDDGSESDQTLSGLYLSGPLPWAPVPGANLDAYWLRSTDDARAYAQEVGREHRNSFGLRFWGDAGGSDYNLELIAQAGTFGDGVAGSDGGDIRAAGAAFEGGHRFAGVPFDPRVGLGLSWFSGDDDPTDADIQTFNLLFPRASLLSEAALIGQANAISATPSLSVYATDSLRLIAGPGWHWRASTDDGLYDGTGQLVNPEAESTSARFIGTNFQVIADWAVSAHVNLLGVVEHFQAGPYLDDVQDDEGLTRLRLQTTFRF